MEPVTDNLSCLNFLYDFGRDQFTAACAAQGITPELRYGKAVAKEPPADDVYWARLSRQIVSEEQETLRQSQDGTRRFVSIGIFYVQLFFPITDSKALFNLAVISDIVRNSFRHFQGDNLEFTNPWINDNVPTEPTWIRANVVSNYQYRQYVS